jgi:hypothetical protein
MFCNLTPTNQASILSANDESKPHALCVILHLPGRFGPVTPCIYLAAANR